MRFRSTYRYREAVGRKQMVAFAAAGAIGVALVLGGCGGASSVPASHPATTSASATPVEWLTAHIAQWNARLNSDQNAVDTAASATKGVAANTFYGRLGSACTKMLDDAAKAKEVPRAPTAALESAWRAMVSATASYASRCMDLVRSRSPGDLSAWQNTLKTMNAASATWNSVVNAARTAATGPTG